MVGVVLGGRSGRGEEEEELDVGSPSHTHKHTYTCMHEEGGEKGNERKREERKRGLPVRREGRERRLRRGGGQSGASARGVQGRERVLEGAHQGGEEEKRGENESLPEEMGERRRRSLAGASRRRRKKKKEKRGEQWGREEEECEGVKRVRRER